MTPSKSLPARPSEESLRKQAKKLARERSLSQREAQLALAREYGYVGWLELVAEVRRRVGQGIEWAASQAQRLIHDNDVEGLKALVAEHPALLTWTGEQGLLGMATSSYGDSGDPEREKNFTRAACAEFLIDAGAVVLPGVCEGLVHSRTKGLLQLFERKGLLPQSLKYRTALGDLDAVRTHVDNDLASVSEAFTCACHFQYEDIASFLLHRLIALDAELGAQVEGGPGRAAFLRFLIDEQGALAFIDAKPSGPWQTYLMQQVVCAIHNDELATFVSVLQRERWMLDDAHVGFQVGVIERAILRDRGPFIAALLDLNPTLLRRRPPPQSQALEFAFTYAKAHLLPTLTRVWPVPDDLPHAAGMGDLDGVKKWTGVSHPQEVLDTALAWSVLNRHFEVADFLLAHGADINTRWSSHEPASILHELVFHEDYEAMQFLIDRGIDMTIKDYRWGGTAEGWAYHAAKNEKMADWLAAAERQRKERRGH